MIVYTLTIECFRGQYKCKFNTIIQIKTDIETYLCFKHISRKKKKAEVSHGDTYSSKRAK